MTEGPFCSVPGCVDHAVASVLFAYTPDRGRVFLCGAHSRGIRRALAAVWAERQPLEPSWHAIRGDDVVVFGPRGG